MQNAAAWLQMSDIEFEKLGLNQRTFNSSGEVCQSQIRSSTLSAQMERPAVGDRGSEDRRMGNLNSVMDWQIPQARERQSSNLRANRCVQWYPYAHPPKA